jgi:hypothetical protein
MVMDKIKDFKYFVFRLLLFLTPIILLLIMVVIVDPFKVYRDYDDYYRNNFVTSNREFVCLKLYERNSKVINYDSFIFGNSRSQAFKVKNWEPYLPPGSKGFHFDGHGSGVGIYHIYNRIRYIDETGGKLGNVILVLDEGMLTATKNLEDYKFISPPELSKESSIEFYYQFLKPLADPKFVIGYIDYSIFGKYREYMTNLFLRQDYGYTSDNLRGDIYYGWDRMIAENPKNFYQDLVNKGVFYHRDKNKKRTGTPVTEEEKELLVKIKKYFDKHHTDYRIVISPQYTQIPLGENHLTLLCEIFGSGRVYNYSGVNRFTESMYNHYESTHFRPLVANEIMKEMYTGRGKLKAGPSDVSK